MEPPLKAQETFYDYYASITNVLGYNLGNDPEYLLSKLISQRVMTTNDKIVIDKAVSPSEKVGRLLNIISGPLSDGNQASFEKLLQIMANGNNKATQDLAIEIMKKIEITPIISK